MMQDARTIRRSAAAALLTLGLLAALCPRALPAAELQPGLNTAGMIAFPTALDQPLDHSIAATLAVFDVGEPDIRAQNVRYGFQWGNAQLLADANFSTEPKKEFDHAEVKAKLRLVTFDKFASSVALGLLGRITDSKAGDARIDEKPFSFFGIFTVELFPFHNWGGFLVNVYLDNRFLSTGLKVQLIDQLQFVGETAYLHSTDVKERTSSSVGIEIAGEQNFYFQVFYNDPTDRVSLQLGTGF